MSDETLDLLRRLDAEATPGPWRVHRAAGSPSCSVRALRGAVVVANVVTGPAANAELIATLRTLLPELLAVVEAASLERFTRERDEALARGAWQGVESERLRRLMPEDLLDGDDDA